MISWLKNVGCHGDTNYFILTEWYGRQAFLGFSVSWVLFFYLPFFHFCLSLPVFDVSYWVVPRGLALMTDDRTRGSLHRLKEVLILRWNLYDKNFTKFFFKSHNPYIDNTHTHTPYMPFKERALVICRALWIEEF